jgi:hypothetical protein
MPFSVVVTSTEHYWVTLAKRRSKSLNFNPQQLHPVTEQRPGQNPQPVQPQRYNSAVFTWQTDDGMEAVHKILSMLLKKEEHQEKPAA